MNPLCDNLNIGTIGELLVQIRLLEFGVQAAPPIKDSGNDLIAIKGNVFKSIQVKTSIKNRHPKKPKNRDYHIFAYVKLEHESHQICLDKSKIYLIDKDVVDSLGFSFSRLESMELKQERIDQLF